MIGDNSLPDYPSLRACGDVPSIANPVVTVSPELTNFAREEKNETLTTLHYLPPPSPTFTRCMIPRFVACREVTGKEVECHSLMLLRRRVVKGGVLIRHESQSFQ